MTNKNVVTEWKNKQEAERYQKFSSQMERVLTSLVAYDLGGSGQYLDDEIGGEDFNNAVAETVEKQTKGLWDYYNDTIGDTVTELLGSDFMNTI